MPTQAGESEREDRGLSPPDSRLAFEVAADHGFADHGSFSATGSQPLAY